ncbi:3-dehydroquinate synthase [Alkalihalobacillus sp. AL-G]|uniref:3-dehydroquinate synthase n=1 Tax=Alkalihalobacillus sp. AL-G TaxID=2926399 RepID=UPI00272A2D54|nr:3-dehydroquinate synthase [Alkalihalobacillus sp. AL-G]WLD91824.1 3-dehydroquinate synthase [Alkalihalobacillus sp. AL-G]
METIDIKTGSKQYPVHIGGGASTLLQDVLHKQVSECSGILIITDSNVAPLYLREIKSMLTDLPVFEWVIPAGESSKSLREYEKIISYALNRKLDRKSVIVALGGGVVGDIAGFVAATYLRGVAFIQMPTTLLAHDSSVGGKVGVNHTAGKNLIGAFYQPEAVIYDLHYLKSLSRKEWRSGFAEIIKSSLIRDHELYRFLNEKVLDFPIEDDEALVHAVFAAISIKAGIVQEDEYESGVRAYLNFGHTLGHAIEAESRYQHIPHGEAVMIGMLFSIRLSERIYGKSLMPVDLLQWIKNMGYSIWHPSLARPELLIERMKQDKKNAGQEIRMVLYAGFEQVRTSGVPEDLLLEELKHFDKWSKKCESS